MFMNKKQRSVELHLSNEIKFVTVNEKEEKRKAMHFSVGHFESNDSNDSTICVDIKNEAISFREISSEDGYIDCDTRNV